MSHTEEKTSPEMPGDAPPSGASAQERLTSLQKIALALSRAVTAEQVAEMIIAEGFAALGANSGSISILTDDRSEFLTLRCLGYAADIVHKYRRYPAETALPNAEAARTGKAIYCESRQERDERYPHLAGSRTPAHRGALAAFPLVVNDRVIGGLMLSFPEDRCFSPGDRAFMQTVTQLSAQALERARAFDSAQQDISERLRIEAALQAAYQRERLINEIGQTIRNSSDPREIQAIAVDALGSALSADRCFYVLIDLAYDHLSIGQDWHRAGLPALAGDYRSSQISLDVTALFRAGKTLAVSETQRGPWLAEVAGALAEMQVRALLAVPFHDQGQLVAALGVGMADGPRAWTEMEVGLVEAVATATRAALESARVVQKEHRIAEVLQRSFLLKPAQEAYHGLEIEPVYKAAWDEALVGGDFFDSFLLDGGRVALVVGDVSGKGLAAAARTAEVKFTLRAYLREHPNPARALQRLNFFLCQSQALDGRLTDSFTCLSLATVDTASGEAVFSVAGAEAPLILRGAGNAEPVALRGLPLGVAPKADYAATSVSLGSGDLIVMVTDGITEARRGRDFLGSDGLAAAAQQAARLDSLPEIGQAILESAQSFAGGALSDDVCILLTRRAVPPN